jgi:hypothetical protein
LWRKENHRGWQEEVLGSEHTRGAKFWLLVMNELKARAVEDVLIVVCDGLTGLPVAIEAVRAGRGRADLHRAPDPRQPALGRL